MKSGDEFVYLEPMDAGEVPHFGKVAKVSKGVATIEWDHPESERLGNQFDTAELDKRAVPDKWKAHKKEHRI